MYRRSAVACLAGVLFLPRIVSAQSAGTTPDLERLRRLIAERLQATSVPSLAVAVVHDGRIAWQEGFGLADRERRVPATPDTPYSLASITKTLTGTAVMRLADRGRLELDRPINTYLGRAKLHSPFWDATGATVRRVANHTAGLTTYVRSCDTEQACSIDGAIEKYGIIVHAPGADFDYSNLGYGILGDVIARTSGRTYAAFLREEIFQPLKMTSCGVASMPDAAVRYNSGTHEPAAVRASGSPAASSALCSAHDLALFSQWLMTSGSPLSVMRSLAVPAGAGQQYAFGWWFQADYFGYPSISGSGGTTDTSAALRIIPSQRIAVIALSNTGTALTDQIIDETLSEFLPRIREKRTQAAAPASAAAPRPRPAPSDALVGPWTGYVMTPAGKRSLSLDVSPSGDVRTLLEANQQAPFARGGAVRSRIYGQMPGDLRTDDAPMPPYDLDIGLELQGQRLIGSATTHTRPGRSGPALSYWVELQKPASSVVNEADRLSVSRPVARVIAAATMDRFVVELGSGDRAAFSVTQAGRLDLSTFSPDGQLLQKVGPAGPAGERGFVIAADRAGAYRIELSASAGESAKYEIELDGISTLAARQRTSQPAQDTESRDQQVNDDDLRILERADAVLSTSEAWSRHDTRICLPGDRTRSLFCALEKAQIDLFGEYRHRAVALQEVRFAIEDVTNGRPFAHRLMDYNNLPTTQFVDIKRVLTIASHRVRVRLDEQRAAGN